MSGQVLTINPLAVEQQLDHCGWTYPSMRDELDPFSGFGHRAMFPAFFDLACELGRTPTAEEGWALIQELADPDMWPLVGVQHRGAKLYMDFLRDLHLYGLLGQRTAEIGSVDYRRGRDLDLGIDYVITLLPSSAPIAVQALMRSRQMWKTGDPWSHLKQQRRERRGVPGQAASWPSQIFEISNRTRPEWKAIRGCWLYGPGHVYDLLCAIRGDTPISQPALF